MSSPDGAFATTAWSRILLAQGRAPDCAERRQCLEHLAVAYWTPVYAFICRRGATTENALDLTQAYFTLFLEKNVVDQARPDKGRFRAFLLTSVRNFLANEADYRKAAKRAPKEALRSLNITEESSRAVMLSVAAASDPPETAFMREWARAVVAQAMERLRHACETDRTMDAWRIFDRHLNAVQSGADRSYEATAQELGFSVEKVRKGLFRARKRFSDVLREVIRESVTSDAEVDDELKDLRQYFA